MTPRLLLIDNYDSFTYNLVQAFLVLGADVHVYRNDAMTVEEALAFAPSHLCISPGPGTPYDAGVSMDMIRAFAGKLPVLEGVFQCNEPTSRQVTCYRFDVSGALADEK